KLFAIQFFPLLRLFSLDLQPISTPSAQNWPPAFVSRAALQASTIRRRSLHQGKPKMRCPAFLMAACLAPASVLTPAHAAKRVAPVVGNQRYPSLSSIEQLPKAGKDARPVGATRTQIGFEAVSGENLGRQALPARLDDAAQCRLRLLLEEAR